RHGRLPIGDGRSAEAQYAKRVRNELIAQCGGTVSASQRLLIDRIASLRIHLLDSDTSGHTGRHLAMRFRGILRSGDIEKFDEWLRDAHASGLYGMPRFVRTLRQDLAAVQNAITEPWSNGQTEGQINRLKTLKRAMYGRAGVKLLRARILPFQPSSEHAM
ncbi:MAG: transposase, partial [Rhodopila sp.]